MTTTTTVNPFATAEAFADFPVPHDLQRGHLGSYAHTMSVREVRKVQIRNQKGCSVWARDVWTRSAEADASTDFRTVILHTMDVATDDMVHAYAVVRAVFMDCTDNTDESVELVKTMDQMRMKVDFHPGFIRLMWVEDLS
jgi:hypothetical protein